MATINEVIHSVSFLHNYFEDGFLPKIELIPIAGTAEKLRNYRMLLKYSNNSFHFVQEHQRGTDSIYPVIPIESDVEFFFGINNIDELFQTKTDVPFYRNSKEKLFIEILPGQELIVDDKHLFPFFKKGFTYETQQDIEVKVTVTKDKEKLAEQSIKKPSNFTFSFHDLDIGLFSLLENDVVQMSMLGIEKDAQFDAILKVVLSSDKMNESSVKFNARSMLWKYVVVSNYGKDLSGVNLKEEFDKVQFEKSDEYMLKGKPAVTFMSQEPLLLSQTYSYFLSLESNGQTIVKNVSFPSLANVSKCSKDENSVEKLCLLTFINI